MMWNWLSKKLARTEQPQRRKVEIDIPYEQHRYRIEDFDRETEASSKDNEHSKA
ncbi:hypothetical protein JK628_08755 [Shewanella sp. KX20019]|uniref:hypothetical protein n=1 Tax=Shewanella sp. KX20019 TaxID=2803864 RepID=UPI0019259653|nr:hypothetical protein [Shewanella sp. KX20019]QQX81878.1 hypothetical protein JK628_08755 [Shewanella sp. KX20019]